jgi:hypothetical protein
MSGAGAQANTLANAPATRKIVLCADDYGIAPGVNRAILDLIAAGRINATSVMVPAPAFDESSVAGLKAMTGRAQIGLHVTLTAPFKPLTADFTPLRDGAFLPLANALPAALARRFDAASVEKEVDAQLRRFIDAFGQPPDFVDGHQHVQLFPQIRDALLKAVASAAPNAWVRQCGRTSPLPQRWRDRKGLLLDVLSVTFRRKARWIGLRTNPAFAGSYDFNADADYARLFPAFLNGLPDGGLVMCHPGFVDDALRRLDPLTDIREREYAYFKSDEFETLLAAQRVTLR